MCVVERSKKRIQYRYDDPSSGRPAVFTASFAEPSAARVALEDVSTGRGFFRRPTVVPVE